MKKETNFFNKETLVIFDIIAINEVIFDFLGISIYFWGISFGQISLDNVVGGLGIWWIIVRFMYLTLKRLFKKR